MSFGMLMPNRNTQSNLQGGYSSGGTTNVNGNTYVSNLTITTRIGNTPNTYKAATSIEFVGEYTDNGGEEYEAFIVNQANPDPNPTTGTVSSNNGDRYKYGFNGFEKDDEVKGAGNHISFNDYGLDTRLGRRWNVDPKAHHAPYESPYSAMGNNPIYFIDPDGHFKIPVHKRITENAFKNSGLSPGWKNFFKNDVKLGVSIEADILGAASDYHFDGRKNYSEVQSTWKSLSKQITNKIVDLGSFNRSMGGDDAVLLGRMIHTVQDFYSHSNYVELYIEYYKGANDGAMPTFVPIYDVANGGTSNTDFNSILKTSLRTGEFDVIDNEFTNPNGKKAQQPTSHNKMNKDKANTPVGKLAEQVATEHTTQILKQVKEKE